MDQEIYSNLINQYNYYLTEEEKQAILIYKSSLFNIINSFLSIDEFRNLTNEQVLTNLGSNLENTILQLNNYKGTLDSVENLFIKNSVFASLHLDDINEFINDVRNIDLLLEQGCTKIQLTGDLVVYRGVVVARNNLLEQSLSLSTLISTSIKMEDAYSFLQDREVECSKHLFEITLHQGMNVLVTPYNILRTYTDPENMLIHRMNGTAPNLLKIVDIGDLGQQEIILRKDNCEFYEITPPSIRIMGENEFFYHRVDAVIKENNFNQVGDSFKC